MAYRFSETGLGFGTTHLPRSPPLTIGLKIRGNQPHTNGLGLGTYPQNVDIIRVQDSEYANSSDVITPGDAQRMAATRTEMMEQLPTVVPNKTFIRLLSYDALVKQARVEVTEPRDSGKGTVNDLKLGTYDRGKGCKTCKNDVMTCPGHLGIIKLEEWMPNPFFVQHIILVLRSVCMSCGKLLATQERLEEMHIVPTYRFDKSTGKRIMVTPGLTGVNRLKEIANQSKGMTCQGSVEEFRQELSSVCSPSLLADISVQTCGANPKIKTRNGNRDIDIKYSCGDDNAVSLQPREIFKILDMISDNDATTLGFVGTHPRDFILRALPVMPPCDRPPVYRDAKLENNPFTSAYINIVNMNIKIADLRNNLRNCALPQKQRAKIRKDLEDNITKLKMQVVDMLDAPQATTVNHRQRLVSVRSMMQGKEGLPRGHSQGVRVNQAARSVIDPDPTLKFGWIRVPRYIAETLDRPIQIDPSNINEMRSIVLQGKANWYKKGHGRKNNGYRMSVDERNREIIISQLATGDTLGVQMRNADWVIANRQPTLHKYGMLGFRVVISNHKAIGLHPLSTSPFNADFDGDEMNLHFIQTTEAIIELAALADSRRCLISAQTNKPIVGFIMNLVSGAYLMTADGVLVSERTFNDALQKIDERRQLATLTNRLDYFKVPRLSGKALFSAVLPEDFYYKNDGVLIISGIMTSGQLTKKHIGAAHKSIIQAIHNDYGKERAADFISDSNFIINRWLHDTPVTVGINDCIPENKEMMDELEKELHAAMLLIEAMGAEPNDPAERQRYEEQIKLHANITEVLGKRVLELLDPDNNLMVMARSGAKGNERNAAQVVVALGQQYLEGQRIARGMPWHTRDSLDPRARGMITSSYASGLDPDEYFAAAMAGREGLLDTATKTADVGHLRNKMSKLLENIHHGAHGSTRSVNNNIISFVTGGNGFNPEFMEMVPLSDGTKAASFIDIERTIGRLNAQSGFFNSPFLATDN